MFIPFSAERRKAQPLLASVVLILSVASCRQTPTSEPSLVAKNYIAAFLTGDYKTAVTMVHPDALEKIRATYLDGLSKVRGTPEEKVFQDAFGGRPSNELERLSRADLYIALREGADKKNPPSFEFRKQSRIEVVSSQMTDRQNAKVRLKISPPSEPLDLCVVSDIELRLLGAEWKVLREIPAPTK